MPTSSTFLRHSAIIIAIAFIAAGSFAQDEYKPKIADASGDAELALKGFVVPPGMTGKLIAAEPLLANPVAFTVTNDGRIIVCETFRQEVGVEDNRNHMNWLDNDLQLESIEEREAMFRRYMGPDVEKWTKEQDRLRMLQDADGDGIYERDTIFAAGFNGLADGTGSGVIEHNGRVYYTCIPKLWSFTDDNKDGVADVKEALHHGYGVRVAFRGHDMHGLVIGPDGRLYYSLGDRGYNVITKEGTRLKRPDTGAVFRCDMDGSNLEVFAFGVRNPQELVFDNDGNLFTGDNNSDSGDQARWVNVVQDGDTGWRMYFQYLDDRGPWNRELIWRPFRFDDQTTAVQPASTLPPIINLGDGPSGLTFYPGVGLPERYNNHFFLADFRGTAGNSGIRSFAVTPKGASFELTDSHQFIWSILATDVTFAPDASVVVSDWVNGWTGEGKGRLYRFRDDASASAVTNARSVELLGGVLAKMSETELADALSNPDRRVRQEAQFELARRDSKDLFVSLLHAPQKSVATRHAMWGLWQLGLRTSDSATTIIPELLHAVSDESNVFTDEDQTQALRIIGDLIHRHGMKSVPGELRSTVTAAALEMMTSDNLRVAGFAAVMLGRVGTSAEAPALLAFLDRVNNSDPVARHQASMGLTYIAQRTPGLLASLSGYAGAPGRVGIALAMRRLEDASIATYLNDADPLVMAEAARAINDLPIEAAQPALAAIVDNEALEDAVLRRAMNAAYRLGTSNHAAMIAKIASNPAHAEEIRIVAATMLETWNRPQNTDTVTGRWRPLPVREVDGLQNAISSYLPGMLGGSNDLRKKTIAIATSLGVTDLAPSLKTILHDTNLEEGLRVAAFRALVSLERDSRSIVETGLKDPQESVQLAAVEALSAIDPETAVLRLNEIAASGSIKAQQSTLQLLGTLKKESAEKALLAAFERLQKNQLPAAAVLDLLMAAEAQGTNGLKEKVTAFRKSQTEAGLTLALWSDCLEGGDVDRGKSIFFGRSAASCRRCHKVASSGGDVGPALTVIGREKDRNYLLEAIVDPNAKIAKGFETTILVTVDGLTHSGILRNEDDKIVQLMTPTGSLVSVAKEDIEERLKGQSGMPQDLSKNLTRSEIRDLVEYLTTLKTEPSAAHGEKGKK